MWIVCYSCCLSFKNRAVVTQLKPWACPAPRCPLPGWQHFLPGPRAFLPGLIAHKTWHSAGMHLRAIQGNRLLSASTNNCHRQNAVFISRHTLSFLGGINTTQKEQGKNPLHLQLSFFPEILIFCCWAKDKSNKYGIDVHTSKRRFRKRCPIQIDYILFYVLLYYACMCFVWVLSNSATPWTVTQQTPLFMEFSRQEYWSGLPFPTLGVFPNPGIKPTSLVSPELAGRFFTHCTNWEASLYWVSILKKRGCFACECCYINK